MREMKIWDLPTRLFHWSLVSLVLVSWLSAEMDRFDLHYWSGYGILTLLLFRLIWGVLGSDTARLSACLNPPKAIIAHIAALRTPKPEPHVGHNPLGGLAVLAMLAALLTQAVLGLFSQDIDFINNGPLADLVSFDAGTRAAELHILLFDGILILIAIHLTAIFFYSIYKGENLIGAMLSGWRRFDQDGPMTPPSLVPNRRAAVVFGLAAAAVWAVVALGPRL
ncbi:MAG: cytochrome b/b6 domain-containing protein [Alphaproteobacteria bacterium]|nr:cytochrome b/b6 domain-containing protein [Alphaproteobacteria bacterium]